MTQEHCVHKRVIARSLRTDFRKVGIFKAVFPTHRAEYLLAQKGHERALAIVSRFQASLKGEGSQKPLTMVSFTLAAACLSLLPTLSTAEPNLTTPLSSYQILPDNFKPPQVFKNANLLRNINLEKAYVKEIVNVVIENIDAHEQDTYYIPFKAETIGKVGGLEVRDKKDAGKPAFRSEVVEYDPYRFAHSMPPGLSQV